ncbi:MAG: hypothetical protein ABL867_11905, partial [Rickettsiales bacterium]
VELSEADLNTTLAALTQGFKLKKERFLTALTPEALRDKIQSFKDSDKDNSGNLNNNEPIELLKSILPKDQSGKIFHDFCELAADDYDKRGIYKQILEGNAKTLGINATLFREIALATQKGQETPKAAIESYVRSMTNDMLDVSPTNNSAIINHIMASNEDIAITLSKHIHGILKNDRDLTEKTATIPDVSALRTLDANSVCIGVNNRGIGRGI